MFLPILETFWDAHNQLNKHNLYAKEFLIHLIGDMQTFHFYETCKYVFLTNVSRKNTKHQSALKMGSLIEPGNIVSQGYSNFQKKKTTWMTIVHHPRFRI